MMNQGQQWGWRKAAVKLLIAPVVAAGITLPAMAQNSAPAARTAATQPVSRNADPKELLKQGREALKAGQLDRALDCAKQADASNASGKWGLFDDTPESLEKDVASARGKAGKVEAEKLTKQAKDLFNKPTKTAGERIANLDQAYAMADKAFGLAGPSDFFDDVFGSSDRPEKLKKDIDTARQSVRKANPGLVRQAAATTTGKTPGVQQAVATGKPMDGKNVTQATAQTPMPAIPVIPTLSSTSKTDAAKMVADGRALLKAGRIADAKAKATEASKLNASFATSEDSPDSLTRDVMAEGKTRIDQLVREAGDKATTKDFTKAEASLTSAGQLATSLGFPTRTIDDQLAIVRSMNTTTTASITAPVIPTAPAMPSGITAPAMKVPTVAAAPVTAPVIPVVPAMTAPVIPTAPVASAPGVLKGSELLSQARASLRSNDLEMARKLAGQAFNLDPMAKEDAQALLREIDAESYTKQRKEAITTFNNAVGLIQAKQYEHAMTVFKLIDADALTTEQKEKFASMVKQCETELAKLKAPVVPVVTTVAMQEPKIPAVPTTPSNGVTTPVNPLPAQGSGLTDQAKALADVEFGKLRSEGLETEAKARDAFNRGETDLAIQMLTDFTNKVKGSKVSESRQGLLLTSVERRLEGFRIMKRQTDFYASEAKTRTDNRTKAVGKQLAEQQKTEDIKRKVNEVNELVKQKKYRQAEELALQTKSLDADDATLNALYEITKRQRREADYRKLKDDKEESMLGMLNEADRSGVVPTDGRPLVIDAQKTMANRMRGSDNNLYTKPLTQAEREIEVRLERPITVEFNNISLREAVNSIRLKTGLNITTDDYALAEDATALDKTMVTETLKDLSVRNVLSLLLEKANLRFVSKNDVLSITTEKRARGQLYTKVFSVMELVTPIPDFALAPHQSISKALAPNSNPAPVWQTNANGTSSYQNKGLGGNSQLVSGQMPGVTDPMSRGSAVLQNDNLNSPMASSATLASGGRSNHSEQLMRLIKGMIKPYSWADEGGAGKLSYYDIGGALVVNQTADVIADVQNLLESLRRLQEVSVSVEIRVMSLSESFYERIGVDFAMNIKTNHSSSFERSLTTGQFAPEPFINSIGGNNGVVGYNPSAGGFTSDLNLPVRTNSFGQGVPAFGGYPGPGNGGLGLGLAFLNDIQVYMFMEAAAGDRRINIMQAPKITLFNGQTATVFVSDFAFFTTGLDVVNVGGQFVYIPRNVPIPIGNSPAPPGVQSGQAQPGVSVTVQAIVSSDRRFVRMNLSPTLTSLTSATVPLFPVTAFITPVFEGGSQGVPIPFTQFFQQPSISEINVQTTVSCPDGGTVVLGGLKTLAEGRNETGPPVLSQIPYINRLFRNQGIGRETRHIMIMVTPRIIIQSEEELNQTGTTGIPTP
jgi:Flp pilus assembly secretin CpaC/tetratricopeptide (TPR) repeat protein